MKNSIFIAVLSSACAIFSSCATAIKTPSVELTRIENEVNAQPTMDFIGFKIDSTILSITPYNSAVLSEFEQAKTIANTSSLKNLGNLLETAKIAEDKSFAYFGIYSLQEIEAYKSKNRYVTFIEVARNKLLWDDNSEAKNTVAKIGGILGGTGGLFTGFGIAFKNISIDEDDNKNADKINKAYDRYGDIFLGIGIPTGCIGLLLSCIAGTSTKTEIYFDGIYNIYIYDSQTNQIIRKEPVSVKIFETLKGSYDYDNASKNAVNEYISAKTHNALLIKYQEINRWLKNRE